MSIVVALMRYHALHPEKSSTSMHWMPDRWLEEAHAQGRNECQQSAFDTARRDNGHNCSKTRLFRHRYLATRWHLRQQDEKRCSDKDIFINRAVSTTSLDKRSLDSGLPGNGNVPTASLQQPNAFLHSSQVLHQIYWAVASQYRNMNPEDLTQPC